MRFFLLIAGAFLCAVSVASAAECEFEFEAVVGQFQAAGAPVVVIDPAELPNVVANVEIMTAQDMGEVSRGFFAQAGGKILLGLEVDGCLVPPIAVGIAQPTGGQLSGKDDAGRVGA